MGDRGNVVLHYGANDVSSTRPAIFVYTHWEGTELPETLARSLDSERARSRWNDDAYLARIIIDDVCRNGRDEETGFGVALSPPDNEHPLVHVFFANELVQVGESDDAMTFEAFVAAYRPPKVVT